MTMLFPARAIAKVAGSVHVRLLRSDHEAAELFRLRHRLYVDAGFLPEGSSGQYSDRFDGMPSTVNLGIFDKAVCRGGLRLCIAKPGDVALCLPCGEIGAVSALRAKAEGPVVELSRLVVEPTGGNMFYRTSLTALLIRTSMIFCRAFDAQYAVIAARPMLVPFYRSAMGFEAITGEVRYPPGPGDEPVVLMAVDLACAYAGHGHAFFEISDDEVEQIKSQMRGKALAAHLRLSRKAS